MSLEHFFEDLGAQLKVLFWSDKPEEAQVRRRAALQESIEHLQSDGALE